MSTIESGRGFSGGDITVLTSNANDAERAAVAAILNTALVEQSTQRAVQPRRAPNAWERSQRPLRTPIATGATRWNNR